MPSRVRLVYSTVAMYTSILVRVGAGLAFSFILARRLPVEDFAALGVLIAVSLFYHQAGSLWGFWAARAAARRTRDAATKVVSGLLGVLLAALAGLPLLAVVGIVEERILGWDPGMLLCGYPYLAIMVFQAFFRDVVSVVAPHVFAKARIASELARLALGFLLVWLLRLGYPGALAAIIAAPVASAVISLRLLLGEGLLAARPSLGEALQMARLWRVPLPQALADSSPQLMRPAASWASGSSLVVAYLNIALTGQSSLVQAAVSTSLPLYGRLLSGGERGDTRVSIALYLLFAGTFSAALLASSKSLATFYNPAYSGAWLALDLVVAYALALGVASIYRSVLLALDTADAQGDVRTSPLMVWITRSQLKAAAAAYALGVPLAYVLRAKPSLAAAAIPAALTVAYTLLVARLHARIPPGERLTARDAITALAGLLASAVLGYNIHLPSLLGVSATALAGALLYLGIIQALSPDVRSITVRMVARALELAGLWKR